MQKMSQAEAECTYGHLLLSQRRFDEARARFEAALRLESTLASAHTGLGLIPFLEGRVAESLPALRKGAQNGPNDVLAQYALGLAAMRCKESECTAQLGDASARTSFSRAVQLLPQFPDALSNLGFAEMAEGANLDDAEAHIKAAVALLPGREAYRYHLAQVYMRKKQYSEAQALLGPLAARTGETRVQAREMLGVLTQLKNAEVGSPPLSSAGAAPPAPDNGEGRSSAEPTSIPVYRTTLAGESRIEGVLESIECSRTGVVLVVRAASGGHRFSAASLNDIEFITHRDDLTGTVTCGPQPGAKKVFVTSRVPKPDAPRLPTGIEGVVVAVEYLPRDRR